MTVTTQNQFFYLNKIQIGNFPIPPIIDDVRELTVTSWGIPFGYDKLFTFNANVLTNDQPFRISSNPDGSYNLKVRFRSYLPAGRDYPLYVMIDYNNNDPKGFLPKLLKPNFILVWTGTDYRLAINDYYAPDNYVLQGDYQNFNQNDVPGVVSLIDCEVVDIGTVIHYTLDGTTPTVSSPVYDPYNPPAIDPTQAIHIKAFITAPHWQNSDIQSTVIDPNKIIPVSVYGNPYATLVTDNFPSGLSLNSFTGQLNLNSDSLFLGYQNVLLQFTLPTQVGSSYITSDLRYSLDGGITSHSYTTGIPLPVAWKTPVGHAGNPSIFAYITDAIVSVNSNSYNGNSYPSIVEFFIRYPNWNLRWAITDQGTIINSQPVLDQYFTIVNNQLTVNNYAPESAYVLVSTLLTIQCENMQGSFTFLDDFRYYELVFPTLIDTGNFVSIVANNFRFSRDGSVTPIIYNSSTGVENPSAETPVPNPSLAWGQGDVIRVHFNYRTGAVRFNVAEIGWTSWFTPDFSGILVSSLQRIGVAMQYNDPSGNTTGVGNVLKFNFKQSQQAYDLPDNNTLVLDTSA